MQIFLFVALAISILAVVFALQNIVPVTVAFLVWTFQGSLALVLIVALAVGALISFLSSLPALVKHRWASAQLKKQVASLEASLEGSRRELDEVRARLQAPASTHGEGPGRQTPPGLTPGSTLEPSA